MLGLPPSTGRLIETSRRLLAEVTPLVNNNAIYSRFLSTLLVRVSQISIVNVLKCSCVNLLQRLLAIIAISHSYHDYVQVNL